MDQMFNKKMEVISHKKLKEIQQKRLKETIHHVYNNVPFYKNKFKELNITPDDILIDVLNFMHLLVRPAYQLPFVTH